MFWEHYIMSHLCPVAELRRGRVQREGPALCPINSCHPLTHTPDSAEDRLHLLLAGYGVARVMYFKTTSKEWGNCNTLNELLVYLKHLPHPCCSGDCAEELLHTTMCCILWIFFCIKREITEKVLKWFASVFFIISCCWWHHWVAITQR